MSSEFEIENFETETFEEVYSRVYEEIDYEVIRHNLLRFIRYNPTRRVMTMIIREFMNLDDLYRVDLLNFYNYLSENNGNNGNQNENNNHNNNDRLMIDQLINQSRYHPNLFRILNMICEQCGKML